MNLLVSWLLNAAALVITAYLVPNFDIVDFPTALLAAIVFGFANTFLRPVLLVLTMPLNILTLGLFTFVVNAAILWVVSLIVPGFIIGSLVWTVLAAAVLAFVSTLLSHLLKDLRKA